jgi:hypothetical protein
MRDVLQRLLNAEAARIGEVRPVELVIIMVHPADEKPHCDRQPMQSA